MISSISSLLHTFDHRPWPLPARPWAGRMRWCDLAFLHWPLEPAAIAPFIPAPLELDTFDGKAWVGVVPFRMEAVRPRYCPPVPGAHAFPEVNVRTYARYANRTGVWFFSLDATSRMAVRGARVMYNLPYFDAIISIDTTDERIAYSSNRVHRGAPSAQLRVTYSPTSPVYRAEPGTLEHFLAERYCLFARSRRGEVGYIDVHHAPWPLQRGVANIEANTLSDAAGILLPDMPPVVHFARSLDVLAWSRKPLNT